MSLTKASSTPCATISPSPSSAGGSAERSRFLRETLTFSQTLEARRFSAPRWRAQARDDQWPPALARNGEPWTVWLVLGGRGAGKTRTGAEWARGVALGLPGFAERAGGRIALVGETLADAREIMVEGPSGLLALHPARDRPAWSPSRRRLAWANGAVAQLFSSEDPDALRGPQFDIDALEAGLRRLEERSVPRGENDERWRLHERLIAEMQRQGEQARAAGR